MRNIVRKFEYVGRSNTDYDVKSVVVLLVSCLSATLISLTIIDPFKYVAASHLENGGSLEALPSIYLTQASAWDFFLFGVMFLSFSWIAIAEFRHGAISKSIEQGSTGIRVAAGLALLLWLGHAYLVPGWITVGDSNAHIARFVHMGEGLADGYLRFWSNYFYGGTPVAQFTGPLMFWWGSAFTYLIGDPDVATKVILFSLHMTSAAFVYGLLSAFGLSRFSAFLAALIYAGSFAHLHQVIYRGRIPLAISFAVLPWAFWSLWLVLKSERILFKEAALLSLAVAAGILTHQTTGVASGIWLGTFALMGMLLGQASWTRLPTLAAPAAMALLIAIVAIVPIFAEREWLVMGNQPFRVWFEFPGLVDWQAMLTWHAALSGSQDTAYLGYGVVLFGLLAIALALGGFFPVQQRFLIITFVLLFALSLVVRFQYVRPTLFSIFFATILASFGIHWFVSKNRWAPTAVLALILLDLSSTAIYPLYRTDKTYFADAAERLIEKFPNQRIISIGVNGDKYRISVGPNGGILARFKIQKLDGPHNITVPLSHNYLVGMLKKAEKDLNSEHSLSNDTRYILCLHNVAALVNIDQRSKGLLGDLPEIVEIEGLGGALILECATPAIAAPTLATLAPDGDLDSPVLWGEDFAQTPSAFASTAIFELFDKMIETMGGDLTTRVSTALTIRDEHEPIEVDPNLALKEVSIDDYTVSADQASLVLKSDGTGFVRLAHPWYPQLRVTHNGELTTPLMGTLGFIVLPVLKGENIYLITAERSLLRVVLGYISLLAFLLTVSTIVTLTIRSRLSR